MYRSIRSQKGGFDSSVKNNLTRDNNPSQQGTQNINQNGKNPQYNPSLISDKTFTEPIYPGSNDVQAFNRPYSPIRKKNEVSMKIGSPDNYKALSGEKSIQSPSKEGWISEKHERWGSLTRQALKFEGNDEMSKTVDKFQQETTSAGAILADENSKTKQQESNTKQLTVQVRNAADSNLQRTNSNHRGLCTTSEGSNNTHLRVNQEPSRIQPNFPDSSPYRNYSQKIKSTLSDSPSHQPVEQQPSNRVTNQRIYPEPSRIQLNPTDSSPYRNYGQNIKSTFSDSPSHQPIYQQQPKQAVNQKISQETSRIPAGTIDSSPYRNYGQNIKSALSDSPSHQLVYQQQQPNQLSHREVVQNVTETIHSPKLLEEVPRQINVEPEVQKHRASDVNIESHPHPIQETIKTQEINQAESPVQKDSDVSSTKSDALLCDPCVNDIISSRKQKTLGSAVKTEQEFYSQRDRDLLIQLEEQELRRREHEARKREASLHNKRAGEQKKASLREQKQREQEEYRNQLNEIEGASAGSLAKQIAKKDKYRQELLGQIEEQQRHRSPVCQSNKEAEATSLLIRGSPSLLGIDVDLKNALLSQINEKREKAAQEKSNKMTMSRQETDEIATREQQMVLRASAQDMLRKEEYRRAIQDGLDATQRRRDQKSAEKLKDREDLYKSLDEHESRQDEAIRRRQAEMDTRREHLLRQIDEKRRSQSPPRHAIEDNSLFVQTFTSGFNDTEAKNRYRDFLLGQIEEQQRKRSQERQPSNEATGLNFYGRLGGVISPTELRDHLLSQISEKAEMKAKNRENELNEAREQIRLQESQREETLRRALEEEILRKQGLRKSHDEMIERNAQSKHQERNQKQLERDELNESSRQRRELEAERIIKQVSDQSVHREILQSQMKQANERARNFEHGERAQQMNLGGSDEKEKLQLKNEREYVPVGTYSQHWNPTVLSPNQLKNDILNQINEKQKLVEAMQEEIRAQNEQIEKNLALDRETRQRAEEMHSLRKQDLRDTLLSQINQKNQERENQKSQKNIEAQALQADLQKSREQDQLYLMANEAAKRNLYNELSKQVTGKFNQTARINQKDQQIEREIIQSNGFDNYHRALEQERNKKNAYRDDLLNQISSSPERIGKIADGNTSLTMHGSGVRLYGGEQLKKDLLDQIAQKTREKEETRARDLDEHNKNLNLITKNVEEAHKKKLMNDQQRITAVMSELAEYRARKQKEKEAQDKQKELDKLGNKDYASLLHKYQKEAAERSSLQKKDLSDTLNRQIMEKSASNWAEQQELKVSASTSLTTRKLESDLADCDRCHKPYEKSKLTNKKSLQLKRK